MVAIHGLQAQEGETAFAFLVLRLRQPRDREGLVELLRHLAPLIPDADAFIDEWTEDVDVPVWVLGIPWQPPDAGHAALAQRRLVESTGTLGVEEAWFFQAGTSLPSEDSDDDEGDESDEDEEGDGDDEDAADTPPAPRTRRASTRDDSFLSDRTDTATIPISLLDPSDLEELEDDDDLGEVRDETRSQRAVAGTIGGPDGDDDELGDDDLEDDEDLEEDLEDVASDEDDDEGGTGAAVWSHGAPPEATSVPFPIDNYPAILDEHDWEEFGIAVKLAGESVSNLPGVLFGFHSLWLAPYGARYLNASVVYDRTHNAAHFWVERFEVPTAPAQQVHHLLWVMSKLHEVVPIVHARFAKASSNRHDETSEPFVLAGNPLLAVYAKGKDEAVDRWLAEQTTWSKAEIAAMLRELAVEIVTAGADEAVRDAEEVDAEFDEAGDSDDADEPDDDDDSDDDDEDEDSDDEDDGDEADADEDDPGRQITSYAGDVLRARATAGKLDPRVAQRLLPILDRPDRYEHRRQAVVDIFGALKYRPAVPAMIKILDTTTIKNSLDSIGKEDFLVATAAALGAIGDPAAIPALSRVVAAPGTHNDKPRPVAADALAACLAATPEPRSVDPAALDQLLETISERNDGELNAEAHFAYGRLVRQLPPERRAEARRKLADADTARDDAIAMLARQAALLLASPTTPIDAPPRDLEPLLRESLTSLDYDHEYTLRNIRVALRVAAIVPEVVNPEDLVWLTRFSEPDIRAAAHVLLTRLGKPLSPAPVFDGLSVRALEDRELIGLIAEPHVVGRGALIGEAGRRGLEAAKHPIINVCHDVISRARQGGENLLDPDTRVLEAAVPMLREPPLDTDVIALFDRMLRHSNVHVKWELLEVPPADERLLGGMFHVLGEKWGWQEKTARQWLAQFAGTPAYEAERLRAGAVDLEADEEVDEEVDEIDAGDEDDDEDMN